MKSQQVLIVVNKNNSNNHKLEGKMQMVATGGKKEI